LINLWKQPNESGEAHTVMRNGRKQEERRCFTFCVAVSMCSCLCPGTHDTQAGSCKSLV